MGHVGADWGSTFTTLNPKPPLAGTDYQSMLYLAVCRCTLTASPEPSAYTPDPKPYRRVSADEVMLKV